MIAKPPGSAGMYMNPGNPIYNTNKRQDFESKSYGPSQESAYNGATAALKGLKQPWDPATAPPLKPSYYSIRTGLPTS